MNFIGMREAGTIEVGEVPFLIDMVGETFKVGELAGNVGVSIQVLSGDMGQVKLAVGGEFAPSTMFDRDRLSLTKSGWEFVEGIRQWCRKAKILDVHGKRIEATHIDVTFHIQPHLSGISFGDYETAWLSAQQIKTDLGLGGVILETAESVTSKVEANCKL
ncbi:hypothetical protein [Flexibacterium corallicola]|uniref:hypothetical protein n=1 Tax=Flexibacterium corallicola TaxID=3037259 RepID=UPI00286F4F71|nr:hypothetical protein [Pseudovibrio sp. M1P-2-3]